MGWIGESMESLRSLQIHQVLSQIVGLGLIVTSALIIWKGLMCVNESESPVVVLLSGSMGPGFQRGDILFLHMSKEPIRTGQIVVFHLDGREIPIVHRVNKGREIPIVHRVIKIVYKREVEGTEAENSSTGPHHCLDWSTISSYLGSPLASPWFATANVAVGFVLVIYVITPITYWLNLYNAKTFPIFSDGLFTPTGQTYNISSIIDANFHLDINAYKKEGPLYLSTFFAMTYGVGFASLTATVTYVLLFHGRFH